MNENKENEVKNLESEVNQSTNTTVTNDKKGFSIAALVLGIIAIILCCIWYVSIPCGIIALILGILSIIFAVKSKNHYGFTAMNIAGLVLGIIGTVLGTIELLIIII